jgi:TolA-binding protein
MEKAAAVIYKTGMALLENDADPREEAMRLFQQVLLQYPTSEVAKWAELRAAICLYYLQRYQDAADACQSIVDKYPGELVAAWAQFHKALAINDLGNYSAAAQEFAKVEDYANLPDHGPIDYARHRAGRTFAELERKIGYKATFVTFGVDPQDRRKMAWTF